jgi:hypothetical protein
MGDDQNPSQTATVSRVKNFTEEAEATIKVVTLAGILLYGLGLLVANAYLDRFGFSDFSILKPQCLFTGIWTFLMLLLASGPTLIYISRTATRKQSVMTTARGLFFALLGALLVTWIAFALFLLIAGPTRAIDGLSILRFAAFPGWRGLLLTMNFFPLLLLTTRPPAEGPSPSNKESWKLWFSAWLGIAIPMAIFGSLLIGYEMFGSVNTEMGGGRPYEVIFYFADEAKGVLTTIKQGTGPDHDNDGDLQIKGNLIYQGSDRYIMQIDYCSKEKDSLHGGFQDVHRVKQVILDKKSIQAMFPTGVPTNLSDYPCSA